MYTGRTTQRSIQEIKAHMEYYGPKIEDVRELCALYERMLAAMSNRIVNSPKRKKALKHER